MALFQTIPIYFKFRFAVDGTQIMMMVMINMMIGEIRNTIHS